MSRYRDKTFKGLKFYFVEKYFYCLLMLSYGTIFSKTIFEILLLYLLHPLMDSPGDSKQTFKGVSPQRTADKKQSEKVQMNFRGRPDAYQMEAEKEDPPPQVTKEI